MPRVGRIERGGAALKVVTPDSLDGHHGETTEIASRETRIIPESAPPRPFKSLRKSIRIACTVFRSVSHDAAAKVSTARTRTRSLSWGGTVIDARRNKIAKSLTGLCAVVLKFRSRKEFQVIGISIGDSGISVR